MKRIIGLIGLIGIIGITTTSKTFAFDRNSITSGARVTGGINNTYNISNTYIFSGPTQVGQNATSLPSYQSIQDTINKIELLKKRLKR